MHTGEENIAEKEVKMSQLLPPDIIMEILIWTDIESLTRLTRVCKEWCRLVSHPQFKNRHHHKSKNVRGFIADNSSEYHDIACRSYDFHFFPHPSPPSSDSLPSLMFMSEPVNIKASTPHGLLLCLGLFNKCYYVCKPTTQEWAIIPTHATQNYTVKMVMSVASSHPLRFRIMRISRQPKRGQYQCEVFDSDSCGMWKTIEGVGSLLNGYQYMGPSIGYGIELNGAFFWIEHLGFYEVTKIICFDLWKEELKTLELPKEATEDGRVKSFDKLSNLHGGLGLVRLLHLDMSLIFEIWALSRVGNRWDKVQVLDLGKGEPTGLPTSLPTFHWIKDDFIVDNTVLVDNHAFRCEIFW